ncbi:MAG: MFS transporter [Chloroflexi bacterium]|nr:MFS transporter [Chloroflexota bacterium]
MGHPSGSTTAPPLAVPWYRRALGPFRSLAYRDFRLLWIGNLANSADMWMEIVARNWLVWQITGSLLGVGMINFVRWLPSMALAIPVGVITDRVDRKALLLGSQALILGLYILLAALALAEALHLWHLYVLFTLLGTASTFSQPARQSLIAQSVSREELTNAMSLQQMAFNGSRLGAPTLAGLIMATWGAAPVFILLALGAVVVVVATALLRMPSSALPAVSSPFKAAAEGLLYVARSPILRLLVFLSFFLMLLGFPFSTLLPEFAEKVFGIGAGGFGLMMSASGAGSLAATLLLASVPLKRQAVAIVASSALFGLSLALFAYTPWLLPALGALAVSGLFSGVQGILGNSLLLSQSEPAYHGRIMSLNMLNHSFMPIGALPAGWMADNLGASAAMAVMGGALVVASLAVAAAHPGFVRFQAAEAPARHAMPAPVPARGGSQP